MQFAIQHKRSAVQAELEEIFLIRMTNNRKKFEGQSSSRSYCTLDTVWDLILWFSLLQFDWVNNPNMTFARLIFVGKPVLKKNNRFTA